MTPLMHTSVRQLGVFYVFLLLCSWSDFTVARAESLSSNQFLATNVDQLRQAIAPEAGRICSYKLEGTVLAADCNSGTLFFQDSSGVAALDVNLNRTKLRAGQRIQLCGTNYVSHTDFGLSLGASPVVDNDGLHSTTEKQGAVFLKAGQYPIQVNWFNWRATAYLKVAYSGPHLAKQVVPDHALWQSKMASENGPVHGFQGLTYRCFEGQWNRMPDFDRLPLKKTGIVSNFDIGVRARPENVGLEFKGFLDVPHNGNYTFYLSSDDGSQLFLGSPPSIAILGNALWPEPAPIAADQPLSGAQNSFWAEVAGTITLLDSSPEGVQFELTSGGNQMRVEVLNASPEIPSYLLHSRVRVRGICQYVRNVDGQKCAGLIVAANWRSVRILDLPPEHRLSFRNSTISSLSNRVAAGDTDGIVRLHGHLQVDPVTQAIHFKDRTGSAPIQLLGGPPAETGHPVECLSRWFWNGTNILLQEAICRKSSDASEGESNAVHLLTTAMQVQQLKPEEARRKYPVELQGVITWTLLNSNNSMLVIQDATRAVYVVTDGQLPEPNPRIGDFCKIRGFTLPGEFSPIVELNEITVLGRGQLPRPVNPTRDQLLNGSLDAQYVELRGMVTATHDSYITLLTSEGTFDVNISPGPDEPWEKLLNSIIRVRGCFFANWNGERQVVLNHPVLRIWAAVTSVDVPAPSNLFQAAKVSAKELMQFNPEFNTFRWVKVSGQIVHHGTDVYYLMDNSGSGLRFRLAQSQNFKPGDDVEVVGLVELGGASPLLRQAVARKIGHSPLPAPKPLSLNSLADHYDSTLVQVEGTLADVKHYGTEQVLQVQVGVKNFVARLHSEQRGDVPLEIGSRLKLTGVFCALDGNPITGQEVSSFELLLNSPNNVQVVALPPWWTLGRLLVVAAILFVGLGLAVVWIALLRYQVERRTVQLRHEIGERERSEKMRAVEAERSRIARDLHDDLGGELTEISMLAAASPRLKINPETASERLQEIAKKSRSMVSALNSVVWVTNPKDDTLTSLVEYLAFYAEEFLTKVGSACRVELPAIRTERVIVAEVRHNVLLAVREALNNAVRHGHPREVLLQFAISEGHLEILVKDDGCGFTIGSNSRGNGLVNLHERMREIGGHCQIQSSPNEGTSVILTLSLPA